MILLDIRETFKYCGCYLCLRQTLSTVGCRRRCSVKKSLTLLVDTGLVDLLLSQQPSLRLCLSSLTTRITTKHAKAQPQHPQYLNALEERAPPLSEPLAFGIVSLVGVKPLSGKKSQHTASFIHKPRRQAAVFWNL